MGDNLIETFSTTSPEAPNHKKRKWWKIVLVAVLVIVILVVTIFFLPNMLGVIVKDIQPIDDSDLSLKKISIPDKENGYANLLSLRDMIDEPTEIVKILSGEIYDEKVIKDTLSTNAEVLKKFKDAAQKPKFQIPAFSDPANLDFDSSPISLLDYRRISRVSGLNALYLVKNGRYEEAIDEALDPVRVGQNIQSSQMDLISYLMATTMKTIGLETLQKVVVSSSNLTNKNSKKYIQELNQLHSSKEGFTATLKLEYRKNTNFIDSITESFTNGGYLSSSNILIGSLKELSLNGQKSRVNFYFKPNETKSLVADYFRSSIENINKPCERLESDAAKLQPPPFNIYGYLTENLIGKGLYYAVAESLTGFNDIRCRDDLLVNATQTMIAIKAFKNDTGTYPPSLEVLVPTYIPSVPIDPFGGKALKYSAEKKIVYSVGKDLSDIGGNPDTDWRTMPSNPTFKIGF